MEAVFQTDSSYFNITLGTGLNITHDVISFEITESVGDISRGSISLYDPTGTYGNSYLPSGVEFNISWGYKSRNLNLSQVEILQKNPLEIQGPGVRKGLKALVISPKWTFNNQGVKVYNCTFYAFEYLNSLQRTKKYTSARYKDMILEVFQNMKINDVVVNFDKQKEKLTEAHFYMQNESDFAYLNRIAYEFKCLFRIGRNQAGNLIAVFVNEIGTQEVNNKLNQMVGGTIGSKKILEYGVGTLANVISADLSKNIGESGEGDGVYVQIINGQPIFTRQVIPSQTVKTLQLNQERLKQFILEHDEDTAEITRQIYSAKTLTDRIKNKPIIEFFDEVTQSTAPQGYGYSCNCEVLGDPTLGPLVEIIFGAGFPEEFSEKNKDLTKFYIKAATHTLSAGGYITKLEIGDNVKITGSLIRG